MSAQLEEIRQKLLNVGHQLETAKAEVEKTFPKEAELKKKQERLNALNALLNMDEKAENIIGGDEAEEIQANMVAETKNEFKVGKPLELQTAEQICKVLGRTVYSEWDESTASLTMAENGKVLKGKEVYDFLFEKAGEYIRAQILSRNNEKEWK